MARKPSGAGTRAGVRWYRGGVLSCRPLLAWFRPFVIALCLATAASACGGDDDGGGDECSLGTDFDCEVACGHLEELCSSCDQEPADGCNDAACVDDCENAKADPDSIPDDYKPLVLGELNCLDAHDTCDGFAACLQVCLGQ
jgi:hypothetical protein